MEDEVEEKIKKLLTDQGIKVSGIGILAENTKEIVSLLGKMNNTIIHLENKVESLMDENAEKKLERIKQRFK